MKDLGIEIRAGVHVGEIKHVGKDIRGIAVHIGARVASSAGPSEILVSSTVRDLVAGSGLTFEDAGDRELKGDPRPMAPVSGGDLSSLREGTRPNGRCARRETGRP